ncbi:MAG TPA: glycoside hydrolase family 38 C-terminal domain-containing protein, partial [Phycisphaerales bacterium]|nr:glycoside hydrolase family 38 C-terminal domain-containing protein [Phycisphaerales bacterium]
LVGRGVEWESAAVPEGGDDGFVSLVWMFGLQVNPEQHRFELRVNGETWVEFANRASAEPRDWTIEGAHGSSLRFRATMVDRFGDLMGYAMLRVPRTELAAGKPVRLGVAGERAGSRAWYITFQSAVSERASVLAPPAVVRGIDGKGDYRPVQVTVVHLGGARDVAVAPSFGAEEMRRLEFGVNRFELRHPETAEAREIAIRIRAAGEKGDRFTLKARLEPVRHWTVDLVQHAHTDIGYSRPQTDILAEHVRFIDTALDACDRTDGEPEDAKFRWTCEGSWAVGEYLRSRTPEQIERLRKRVAEGRIECTGMFLNMSELLDEASFPAFLGPIATLREHGLRVTTAMQDDVNGIAWCLADMLPGIGVKYVVMGQHGHRALIPFGMPTCFWWASPAGKRVLAFRADHYPAGNFGEGHTGRVERVEDELLRYLARLESSRYPFDRVAVQHSGYHTDNSPPSIASSGLVREWNKKYAWPRLRCAVAREFPEWVEANHAKDIPTLPLAWTDWWTDGFGSAARESAAARATQGRLIADEGLLAMQALAGVATAPEPMADIAAVRTDLIFWGEHTLGAAESVRRPFAEESQVQWAAKQAYAWTAAKREASLGESAMGRMRALTPPAETARLVVCNTLGFARSGLVEINVDHELLPSDGRWKIVDERGVPLAVQEVSTRMDGSVWAIWARDIPAMGWREFAIEAPDAGRTGATPEHPARPAGQMENEWYHITADAPTGGIASIIDKEAGTELVDQGAQWRLGQVIYESLGNREQLEGFFLDAFARTGMASPTIEGVRAGPIWDSMVVKGELPGCQPPGGVRCEVRLYRTEKRIELHYRLQKRRVFDPEGIYVAFPFAGDDGKIVYETIGASVAPATDILPGAASDWQAVQSFAAVQWPGAAGGPGRQVVLSSNEIPLAQFGAINLGKFQRRVRIERPHVYSWVMNNYWTTNFVAGQEGEFGFSYALASREDSLRGTAARFGQSRRVPMPARVVPGGGAARALGSRSMLSIDAPGVVLVAARPSRDGTGVVLHLREVEGGAARVDATGWRFGGGAATVREVDALEREVPAEGAAGRGVLEFAPYQARFVLIRGG